MAPESVAEAGLEYPDGTTTAVTCFGTHDVAFSSDTPDQMTRFSPSDEDKVSNNADGLAEAIVEANQYLLSDGEGELAIADEVVADLEGDESAESGDEEPADDGLVKNDDEELDRKRRREEKKRRKKEKKEKKERKEKKRRTERSVSPPKRDKKDRHVTSTKDAAAVAQGERKSANTATPRVVPVEATKRQATDDELIAAANSIKASLAAGVSEPAILAVLSSLAQVRVTLKQLLATQVGTVVASVWKKYPQLLRAAPLAGAITKFWYSLVPAEKRQAAAAASASGSLGRRQSQTPPPAGLLLRQNLSSTKPSAVDLLAKDISEFLKQNDGDLARADSIAQVISSAIKGISSYSQQEDSAAAVLEQLKIASHTEIRAKLLDGTLDPKTFVETVFSVGMPSQYSQALSPQPEVTFCDMYVCPNCSCSKSSIAERHWRAHGEDDHFVAVATCAECSHTWEVSQ